MTRKLIIIPCNFAYYMFTLFNNGSGIKDQKNELIFDLCEYKHFYNYGKSKGS